MKASELRIGNYVDGEGKTIIIESINWDGINGCIDRYDEYSIDALKPIPLTEQWLLDFGFRKYGTYFTRKYGKRVKYHKVTPKFHKESKNYREPYFVYNPSRIEINYVHQLQNLHFSLTGEELTIKVRV